MPLEISRSVVVIYRRGEHRLRVSGFHLRDDLVLTAGHIHGGSGYAVECDGRLLDRDVKLVWAVHEEAAGVDIGLVRVPGLPVVGPVGVGVFDRGDATAVIGVHGWCYPSYQAGVQSVPLVGVIRPASGYTPRPDGTAGMVRLALDDPGPHLDADHPAPGQSWTCASGGAVLTTVDGQPVCVGVISQHYARESPQVLRVATFEAVHPHTSALPPEQVDEFWALLGLEPGRAPLVTGGRGMGTATRTLLACGLLVALALVLAFLPTSVDPPPSPPNNPTPRAPIATFDSPQSAAVRKCRTDKPTTWPIGEDSLYFQSPMSDGSRLHVCLFFNRTKILNDWQSVQYRVENAHADFYGLRISILERAKGSRQKITRFSATYRIEGSGQWRAVSIKNNSTYRDSDEFFRAEVLSVSGDPDEPLGEVQLDS